LPEEAEDEMRFSQDQVISVNVDNVAADGLSRVEGQGKVLVLRVEGQVLDVDGSVVDGVGTGVIDDFAGKRKMSNLHLQDNFIPSYSMHGGFGKETYHKRIPSLTLSYSPFPSGSMGSRCLR
jgi:hypothetical protein